MDCKLKCALIGIGSAIVGGGVVGLIMYKRKPVAATPVAATPVTKYIDDIKNRTKEQYHALLEGLMLVYDKKNGDINNSGYYGSTIVDYFTKYIEQIITLEDMYLQEIYSVIFDFTDQTKISNADKKQIAMHYTYEMLREKIIGP